MKLLDRIHCHLLPRTYVEVGIGTGKSLGLALPGTIAVGIDPEPNIRFAIDRSAQVFAVGSDEFFERHDLRHVLRGNHLDLAFVDGMHLFEYALRDFFHLERFCHAESTILFHDCKPFDAETSGRVRVANRWTGDVWKILLCLKEYRPDLRIATVDVPPTGLAMVRGLDPMSTVLADHYDEICARYIDMSYSVLDHDKEGALNLVADDWNVVRELLPSRPFRPENPARLREQRARRRPPKAKRDPQPLSTLPLRAKRRLASSPVGPALRAVRHPVSTFKPPPR
jgi:hypothetical protein